MKKEKLFKSSEAQPESQTTEGEPPIDKFGEMLAVMDVEHLLRFRKRLEMVGRKEMVKILTFEIKAREAKEREEATRKEDLRKEGLKETPYP